MLPCSICGADLLPGSRTCAICGTSAADLPPETGPAVMASEPVLYAPSFELPPGGSYCPRCVRIYGPSEALDGFCSCGTELIKDQTAAPGRNAVASVLLMDAAPPVPSASTEASFPAASLPALPPLAPVVEELPPMAPILEELPMAPILEEAPPEGKPPPGTPCVVLYDPDRRPVHYFALLKDTTLIGRLDAVAGIFPDIDLDAWFDRAVIRKISRQHALILRSRATRTFILRPLLGNTGTQLEGEMVAPQVDYPLRPGQRIILGGVVRLKFEIVA